MSSIEDHNTHGEHSENKHSHHHHHHHHYEVDKKQIKKKLKSFIHAVKHYKQETRGSQFKMEVHRYFYDNFHGYERHWLRHHCPIIERIKLLLLG
ncbi:MAG: hypothetical protein HUK05_08915, partial [Prevotella sp.]|nr:hypothetical protein [Prevotella sp.]